MTKKKIIQVPKLFFTDKNCVFGGFSRPGVGILVDEYLNPVYPVVDYLISLRVHKAAPDDNGTLRIKAYDLRMFWEYLSANKCSWDTDVDDNFILGWRDRMYQGVRISADQQSLEGRRYDQVEPLNASTINRRIGNIFLFYRWCKITKRIHDYVIGSNGAYQITSMVDPKTGREYWPFRLKERGAPPVNIPTHDEIDKLHEMIDSLYGDETAVRNRLLVSWLEHVGLRSVEVASLRTEMIPSMEKIEHYLEIEQRYPMDFSPRRQNIRTKGNRDRPAPLEVDPMLMRETRDYIDFYRAEIIERAKKKFGRAYKESPYLFLSTHGRTLGEKLNERTVRNAITIAIKSAGLEMTPHDLRKAFAMNLVENLYIGKFLELQDGGLGANQAVRAIDPNDIILLCRQQLGHRHHSTTLKHYLDLTRLKILNMSNAARYDYLERKGRIALQVHKASERSFEKNKSDHSEYDCFINFKDKDLVRAVSSGDKDKIFKILSKKMKDTH